MKRQRLVLTLFVVFQLFLATPTRSDDKQDITKFRVCVTGADRNRPDGFPGLGDFIGWPGGVERLSNGDLLVAHSAGYWHSSFAQPRQIAPETDRRWRESGWPLDFSAPTGGRTMACRSTDGGRSWSKPFTLLDHRLDDGAHALFTCRDGTLLCFIGVQASWYGYTQAPKAFEKDIDGLNTKQFVLRSTDGGKTWAKPIGLKSPGDFYERAHGGEPIQLADGSILWATYYQARGEKYLKGAIRCSTDSGRTWAVLSTISRDDNNVDEPAIAELKDGRLILVTRPDGAIFDSHDKGRTWKDTGVRIVKPGVSKFKAPQLIVLKDGTIVAVATWRNLRVWISRDGAKTWSNDIPLDTGSYGYPGSFFVDDDESIVLPYCASGRAPNRVYLVRFRVNDKRDGIRLQPLVKPEASNARRPTDDKELRYWLDNMIRLHGFNFDEVVAATGLTRDEVRAAVKKFGIDRNGFPEKRDGLLVVPFPGGRHPRIGFLDGAIRPQRETKVSVFTPWAKQDYVVVDVPEAIWSNLGLTYLAHTHIDTIFDKQNITLKKLEWNRNEDGTFDVERVLPNGIRFGCVIRPARDHVRMELWLKNGTKEKLTGMRVQNCLMLKSAEGFNEQTNDNKLAKGSYAICQSKDGRRAIITAWEPLHRAWYNQRCPCLHSDPIFPDAEPGQTVRVRGWLSFYEGDNLDAELKRIDSLGWKTDSK